MFEKSMKNYTNEKNTQRCLRLEICSKTLKTSKFLDLFWAWPYFNGSGQNSGDFVLIWTFPIYTMSPNVEKTRKIDHFNVR